MSSHVEPWESDIEEEEGQEEFATMSSSFMHFDLDEIPRPIWDNCERGYKPWWGER
jgi:hypothetical protein